MHKTFQRIAITAWLLVAVPTLQAAPIQYAGNGHWYEYIGTPTFSWASALSAAASATCPANVCGSQLQGYLVTITDANENNFVAGTVAPGVNYWMGGTDQASEGTWVWAAGPETGQTFWFGGTGGTSSGTDTGYANWNGGEPNSGDAGNNEDFLARQFGNTVNGWNDCAANNCNYGYVIEYSAAAAPAPGSLALVLAGCWALFFGARRRRR